MNHLFNGTRNLNHSRLFFFTSLFLFLFSYRFRAKSAPSLILNIDPVCFFFFLLILCACPCPCALTSHVSLVTRCTSFLFVTLNFVSLPFLLTFPLSFSLPLNPPAPSLLLGRLSSHISSLSPSRSLRCLVACRFCHFRSATWSKSHCTHTYKHEMGAIYFLTLTLTYRETCPLSTTLL